MDDKTFAPADFSESVDPTMVMPVASPAAIAPAGGDSAGAIDWDAVFDNEDGAFATNVDIVFCIDVTGSMGPVLRNSTALARDLIGQINAALAEKKRKVDGLRVKVVAFGDYYCDAEPMVESPFFELPRDERAYHACLDGLSAHGGGDAPESSLEALYKAFTSDWCTTGAKRRHIVVLFTDTSPHPLDSPKRSGAAGYPQDIPHNLLELEDVWNDGQGALGTTERRMAIFAPEDETWSEMGRTWELTHHHPCVAGAGLGELDMQFVVGWIANSI